MSPERDGYEGRVGRLYGRDGLLPGAPPYPWWQWVLAAICWGGGMFVIFNLITWFRFILVNAIVWSVGGIVVALWTRKRIIVRERHEGRLPEPKRN